MRRASWIAVLLAGLSWAAPVPFAAAGETIGIVRNSTGKASITRDSQAFPAPAGTKLFAGDTLSTGPDGSMGAILRDNSTISLGPSSTLVIGDFLFAPAEGKLRLLVRISRGTMSYLSGLIGKFAPESARFETPVASIGIRGTRFAVKVDE